MASNCEIWPEYQAHNQSQPLQTHDIPERPWRRVASDLFTLYSKNYIVFVDCYTDFIEVSELPDSTSETVIQLFIEQFSSHSITNSLMTDNFLIIFYYFLRLLEKRRHYVIRLSERV